MVDISLVIPLNFLPHSERAARVVDSWTSIPCLLWRHWAHSSQSLILAWRVQKMREGEEFIPDILSGPEDS